MLPEVREEFPVVANVDLEFGQACRPLLGGCRVSPDSIQVPWQVGHPVQGFDDVGHAIAGASR
jgi:hypothetical protein